MRAPVRVVVVGQTPPPYGGQAMAIDRLVRGDFVDIQIVPVRMGFSAHMREVGKFRLRKVAHLAGLVARILYTRFRTSARVLYYPPAGPDVVPVLRDLVVLLCTRWAFDRTVFHFHAGGLSEMHGRLPAVLRPLFHRAYGRPDLAIQLSDLAPPDGEFLEARRVAVIPYGIPDDARAHPPCRAARPGPPVVLYVGVLRESKGVLDLVEALRLLKECGGDARLRLVGQLQSDAFEARLRAAVAAAGLQDSVELTGVLTGQAKLDCLRDSDVFCFPTFFESETFGLAVLEAMQFGLPVVATRWRGVPSIVADGRNGYLVPPRDPVMLADRLGRLLADPDLRERMGRCGREIYLGHYTEDTYRLRMERALAVTGAESG